MHSDRRRALRRMGQAAAGCAAFATLPGWAQAPAAFPSAALRFIVPVGPGSGADTSTRFIAERMGKLLGQPAIVENKPGGDFVIAVQALLNAAPDGHALMLISQTSMVVNPVINKSLPYEPLRDIRPLIASTGGNVALVTGENSKFKTVAGVVAAARKEPGSVSMGYYGHFYRVGGLMMEEAGKLRFSHVPYKGAAQEMADLVGGALDLAFIDVGTAMPLIKGGRLRALGVTGKTRNPEIPEVATLDESGFPGYELFIWVGYGVSRKVPEHTARILEAALTKVIDSPDYRAFAAQNGGLTVLSMPGKELSSRIISETERFRALIESAERSR